MRKMTWKTGTAVVMYAVILSAFSIMGLFWLRNMTMVGKTAAYSDGSGVYVLTRQEWLQSLNGESVQIDPARVISKSVFDSYYIGKSLAWVPIVAIALCLFFLSSSLILWLVLQRIQKRESLRLLQPLQTMNFSKKMILDFDPAIQSLLRKISQQFQNHLDDYKRLNSYISHEQKNTLSVLRTRMELKEDKNAVQMIDCIANNMEDILTLCDDVKMSAVMPVDVALICASVCDTYRNISTQITFDFDEDANMLILAKERWIFRAVNRLLDNALKYGEGKPVRVTVENKYHSVVVKVQDAGIGISSEKQELIFQNRYRVNELKKDGYGIGLSLVSHVCNLCGGFAFVESEEGKGSCFYLSFPEIKEQN